MAILTSASFTQFATRAFAEDDHAAIINWVQQILQEAIVKHASDIHFEPQRQALQVRFRIDGLLYNVCRPNGYAVSVIINHLKIRANLDIAEKRLPQDGRFSLMHAIDTRYVCRVSTWPTLYGEKIVLRLLQTNIALLDVERLGFSEKQQQLFINAVNKPQGLILITGPTGSGKTTTLYTALNQLNTTTRNISTIEDPVEIEVENINQLNINPAIGLTFQCGLRALLRQDPDIIMVGEIRDLETATMVVHAAQTGHLVLTTLHTNSALEALSRLALMGISHLDLAESLQLIIAQRLLRRLCQHCKTLVSCDSNNEPLTVYQANHCALCFDGFYGRVGIYQFLEFDHVMKMQMLQHVELSQLTQKMRTTSLWEAGLVKVKQGITSLAELQRVVA